MLWDRGFWTPEGTKDVDAALRKGELKFTLAGEKLRGSFVLVRMKHDRERGKRNNWLLIKHRDEFASDDDVGEQDKSVASGRSMELIAAGKGRGPKPFMAAGSKASAPKALGTRTGQGERRTTCVGQAAGDNIRAQDQPRFRQRSQAGKQSGRSVVMGVTITHPDKALWLRKRAGAPSPSETWPPISKRSVPG